MVRDERREVGSPMGSRLRSPGMLGALTSRHLSCKQQTYSASLHFPSSCTHALKLRHLILLKALSSSADAGGDTTQNITCIAVGSDSVLLEHQVGQQLQQCICVCDVMRPASSCPKLQHAAAAESITRQ